MTSRDKDSSINDRIRLEHISAAARDLTRFVVGRQRADLETDNLLRRGMINAIQEIGEAANRCSQNARDTLDLPWDQIIRMRNIVVHMYWMIDLNVVWAVATEEAAEVMSKVDAALEKMPKHGLDP